MIVQVYNIGAGSSNGTVTMTDVLPSGLEATSAEAMTPGGQFIGEREEIEYYEAEGQEGEEREAEGKAVVLTAQMRVWNCSGTSVVTCKTGPGFEGVERPIRPEYHARIGIKVKAVGSPEVGDNHVTVSGGGAATTAEVADPFTIGTTPPGFGLAGFSDAWFSNADGSVDTQAGTHPFAFTLGFGVNVEAIGGASGAGLRGVKVDLPPGIVGDPHAVPQCSRKQYGGTGLGECSPDTVVGVDVAGLSGSGGKRVR